MATKKGRARPDHSVLRRAGPKRAKRPLRQIELPEWHGWNYKSEDARVCRWIESTLIQPVGVGAGEPVKLAAFQKKLIATICNSMATFISIAAGNGKTTLMAAFALERICRGDDYVEIDVLATKQDQARRLVERCVQMIESSPQLADEEAELFDVYRLNSMLEYRLTGSKMRAHPAKLSAIQGLNFNLALIDEIGEVPPELVTTMLARLGKRPDQRIVGFGTPGFSEDNMLEEIRKRAHANELPPGVAFVEFAADAGCDLFDREQWLKANPAMAAGFLIDTLELKATTMSESEFRAYHLGQPIESSGPWLPYGAWDSCVQADPPRDGATVVLSVWGNYKRQVSIVGATLDGALFFGWAADKPADEDVADVLRVAGDQWDVVEIVYKPHLRVGLMAELYEAGLPIVAWPGDTANDVQSTAEFYKAIAEGEVAHDHDATLSEQVARLTAKIDRHGNPRLVEAEADVAAGLAARAAWWRARALALADLTEELVIY